MTDEELGRIAAQGFWEADEYLVEHDSPERTFELMRDIFISMAKAVRAALAAEQQAALDAIGDVVQELSIENADLRAENSVLWKSCSDMDTSARFTAELRLRELQD